MKKYFIVFFIIILSIQTSFAQEGTQENKNMAAVIYPLSLILTKFSVDFQIGMGNGNLVPHVGYYFGLKFGDTEINSFEAEISYRYILAGVDKMYPKFEGFYVAPLFGFGYSSVSSKSIWTSEILSSSASAIRIGFDLGYQFVWGNFTLNLNTGSEYSSYSSSYKVKDSKGHDLDLDMGRLSGFGWRGLGVGIGLLF